MITLKKLRKLAKEHKPDHKQTLAFLIYCWVLKDPEEDWHILLQDQKACQDSLIRELGKILAEPADEDNKLIESWILENGGETVTGLALLSIVCQAHSHMVHRAFVAAFINIEKLKQRLNEARQAAWEKMDCRQLDGEHLSGICKKYGRDLTALARNGVFDDLCDRPGEIEQLCSVLLRKQKRNIALTGPAGVGKTGLVELLARQITWSRVPAFDPETLLYELNVGQLVAGTCYRGDFEERLYRILREIEKQQAIVFIDEMHLLWGAGKAQGINTDGANLLKPFLARSNTPVIGATTTEEYHRYIAGDAALARRFQEIRLQEPDASLVFDIVSMQAESLARHHRIDIPTTAVSLAITLTNRHMAKRNQPDKSIDLLDTTAVVVKRAGRKEIVANDLLAAVAMQTGRPIAALAGKDLVYLNSLEVKIRKRIIGQDHAVHKVVAAIIQQRLDLGDRQRNLGTFLFAGKTGVGKTELGRVLADVFFKNPEALLQIDLSEYNHSGCINKLLGAPFGYVDSERQGVLIHWLNLYGSGVIIFDEVEKAHPDMHKLLLGLLDNGRISSGRGEVMDTRQCIVILTTNTLSPADLRAKAVGFHTTPSEPDAFSLLEKYFPSEFLARFDELIVFNPLGQKDIRAIVKLRLQEAMARLQDKNITVQYDEEKLLRHLAKFFKQFNFGARGVARLLERILLKPIAMALLNTSANDSLREVILDEDFYQQGFVTVQVSPDNRPISTVNQKQKGKESCPV